MRKLILGVVLLALALLTVNTAIAQVSMEKGALVGLNFATFGGKDATNPAPENKTGFAIGGFLSFSLANMISL